MFATVSYEDLAAFQYSTEAASCSSLAAWVAVVRSLGVAPNLERIRSVLQRRLGTYHTPYPLDYDLYAPNDWLQQIRNRSDLGFAEYLCYPGEVRRRSNLCAQGGVSEWLLPQREACGTDQQKDVLSLAEAAFRSIPEPASYNKLPKRPWVRPGAALQHGWAPAHV